MDYKYETDPGTEVKISNDRNASIEFPFCSFEEKVTIENSKILFLDLDAVHFFGGLLFENCSVECEVRWTAGGHNKKPLIVRNCIFEYFVDFEDCCFEAEVIFENVRFNKDTNLFGNRNTPMEVVFGIEPKILNITGKLDVDSFNTRIDK